MNDPAGVVKASGCCLRMWQRLMPLFSLLLFVCMVLTILPVAWAGQDADDLRHSLEAEQRRVEREEAALRELTAKERRLHKDLARAASKIEALERRIQEQELHLETLLNERQGTEAELEDLSVEQRRGLQELSALLSELWKLYVQNLSGLGRQLPSWRKADRHFVWTSRLYDLMDAKLAEVRQTRMALVVAGERKEELAEEARKDLAAIDRDKNKLLKDRMAFQRRLAEVRQQKLDKEEELARLMDAVERLNFHLSEVLEGRSPPMDRQKGMLPWPVDSASSSIKRRFSPGAEPPQRGLSLAAPENAPVKAVAAGKVVHDDVLRGFGRVVILMHEEAYYSLYAYLAESLVSLGDEVEQGRVLGRAGFYPAIDANGLYFELRFHQKAINPETWLASR